MLRPIPMIAAATLLAVAAWTTNVQARRGATPPTAALERVTVIGDSIATAIEQTAAARRVLGRGIDLDLQVAVCRRLAGESCPYEGGKPPTLVALLPTLRLGSAVVVVVGYNDFEDTFAASLETAFRALDSSGVEHILWLTLRAERESYLRMNAVARVVAAQHPNVTIVDWNVYSRSHPDWFQGDGLHLTDPGSIAMATLVQLSLSELGLVATSPPTIVTTALPPARVGRTYALSLRVTGGSPPIRWTRISGTLPAGLRLAPDGRLTGTPRAVGRRLLSLRATDALGRWVSRRLTLRVSAH